MPFSAFCNKVLTVKSCIKLLVISLLLLGFQTAKSERNAFELDLFDSHILSQKDSQAYYIFERARVLLDIDSLDDSRDLFLKTINLAWEIPDSGLIGSCNIYLGILNNELLEFNSSLESYKYALILSKQLSDTTMMLNAMHGIENYYYQIELLDSVVVYCAKAIEINQLREDYAALSDNYRALCTYVAPSNSDAFSNSFLIDGLMDSCLIAARKAKDPEILVYALTNYGLDYYDRSPETGIDYLDAALDSARNLGTSSDALVYALTKSSEAYFRSGQTDHAIGLSLNALELTRKRKTITELRRKRDQKLEFVHDDLRDRLIDLIEKDEAFLRQDLTLTKVAQLLDTNTSYLSALINNDFKCKFNHFLNRYRIERACELLSNREMDVYSIEGIANMSGFRSKSVFNPVFKEATGVHPSVFRISISKIKL
ncbi:MAG: helix-turn-helix domain-containing protein [Bacteroidetes bacterium]|mgnify:FL=1|nr:helix-turn-helix domain-containing protein [Bacteroidota bacterium]MBT4401564.1 helix-turn-helix domain-containing protein [Bacteroidota bacterium]